MYLPTYNFLFLKKFYIFYVPQFYFIKYFKLLMLNVKLQKGTILDNI